MVFFVRITVNQSHLRPICKSTKFNPKIQRTIYLINFQQLRLHVPDFIRTIVPIDIKSVPIKTSKGNGSVVILPTGTDTFGEQYDYTNNYRATSISFSNSQLPFGWGSIGTGNGRKRNWSHIHNN